MYALGATGVKADGHREIRGPHVTAAADGAGWLAFFRYLTARRLARRELEPPRGGRGRLHVRVPQLRPVLGSKAHHDEPQCCLKASRGWECPLPTDGRRTGSWDMPKDAGPNERVPSGRTTLLARARRYGDRGRAMTPSIASGEEDTATHHQAGHDHAGHGAGLPAELAQVRRATATFHDVGGAKAADYELGWVAAPA